jgi:hypothetical protein
LGRWLSADTIVPEPGNPQSFNRYAYTIGNPLKYVDPTGHKEEGACSDPNEECIDDEIYEAYWSYCAENPGDPACEAGDPVELGFWFLAGISGGIVVEDLILIGGGLLGEGVTKTIGWISSLLCGDGNCTNEAESAFGQLRSVGKNVWESTAGLRYGLDPRYGNRIQHVLRHAVNDPTRRGPHGVFAGGESRVLALVDEAYALAQQAGTNATATVQGARTVYIVDMGRQVGYVGGQAGAAAGYPAAYHIQLVIEAGNTLITAYPVVP